MDAIIVKWVHILGSTILFGTGLGSAFYLFAANRQKNVVHIYLAVKHAVVADWLLIAPAVVMQLVTGMYLVHLDGFRLTDFWVAAGLALFAFIGVCWLPAVWMQIRMRDLAYAAMLKNENLPERFWRLDRWWIILGLLAFAAVIVVFWLMVAKPT
jgi:uncharacterized membrane protein